MNAENPETIGRAHARFTRPPELIRDTEWLLFVKECNRVKDGTFGAPESTAPWWAGGDVEDYPDARIIRRDDGSLSIVAKTAEGDRIMREAASRLGVHIP